MGEDAITPETIHKAQQLAKIADERGQTLAQMALAWILKDKRITSVLVGASKPEQITDSIKCLINYHFSDEELGRIEVILGE